MTTPGRAVKMVMRQREAARSMLDLGDGGAFQLRLENLADLAVFGQQLAEFLLLGEPLGAPVLVDGDAQADWISFLAHRLFV